MISDFGNPTIQRTLVLHRVGILLFGRPNSGVRLGSSTQNSLRPEFCPQTCTQLLDGTAPLYLNNDAPKNEIFAYVEAYH